MTPSEELAGQMARKTDRQLQEIFARPTDWSSEALAAATGELARRRKPNSKLNRNHFLFGVILVGCGTLIGAIGILVIIENDDREIARNCLLTAAVMVPLGIGLMLISRKQPEPQAATHKNKPADNPATSSPSSSPITVIKSEVASALEVKPQEIKEAPINRPKMKRPHEFNEEGKCKICKWEKQLIEKDGRHCLPTIRSVILKAFFIGAGSAFGITSGIAVFTANKDGMGPGDAISLLVNAITFQNWHASGFYKAWGILTVIFFIIAFFVVVYDVEKSNRQ